MKNTEIKLIIKENGLDSFETINAAIQLRLDEPLDHYRTIEISPTLDLPSLTKKIEACLDCTVRRGTTGGCYGMRDGSQSDGLTLWVDANELTSEYKSKEYGYVYNFHYLLKENGELVENLEGDAFIQACEDLELTVKMDNTYNHDNKFMFDVQFTTIENEKQNDSKVFLVVMYHCGGDARGNYTNKQVWKFDSIDDVYSVLLPPDMEDDE